MRLVLNPPALRSDEVAVFAYGSNMLTAWLQSRAPGAKPLGAAFLDRFTLRWNKRSSKDGSAKCSIEETGRREDFVWGVLYGLDPENKRRLDEAEGLGRGYGERSVTVLWEAKPLRVLAYYATSVNPTIKPYDWYKELVVAGAREHGLPIEYLASLESVATTTDSNTERAAQARKLLAKQ